MRIILASQSPRRRELLGKMGYEFEIIPAEGDEIITGSVPSEVVMNLAEGKAREVFERVYAEGIASGKKVDGLNDEDEMLVIGADTVVVKGDRILGKPKDEADAVRMLSDLSGDVHHVLTGVCLIKHVGGITEIKTFYESTEVEFYEMTAAEIAAYAASGEPMDKAGAYGIQGGCAIYVKGIKGDYNNVVGLPAARLYHEIINFV